jgi:hypothetical protein
MYLLATSTTAFVVQSFLIRRYHYLSVEQTPLYLSSFSNPKRFESPSAKITWASCAMVFLSLGAVRQESLGPTRFPHQVTGFSMSHWFIQSLQVAGAFGVAILMIIHKDIGTRRSSIVPVTTWLTLSATTDCSIAVALVIQLRRMRSGFKSSEGLVRRIAFTSIQTGAATSILALLSLGAFTCIMMTNDLLNNGTISLETVRFVWLVQFSLRWSTITPTLVSIAFGFCLGCTYTLTMLHNLNKRKELSDNREGDSKSFQGEPGSLGLNMTGNLTESPVTSPKTGDANAQNFHQPRLETSSTLAVPIVWI